MEFEEQLKETVKNHLEPGYGVAVETEDSDIRLYIYSEERERLLLGTALDELIEYLDYPACDVRVDLDPAENIYTIDIYQRTS